MLTLSKCHVVVCFGTLSAALMVVIYSHGSGTAVQGIIQRSDVEISHSMQHSGVETSYGINRATEETENLLERAFNTTTSAATSTTTSTFAIMRSSSTNTSTTQDPIAKFIATGKRYVLHNFGSRLGNHMFQHAFLRSTAEKFNATATLPASLSLLHALSLDALIVTNNLFEKFIKRYGNVIRRPKKCCAYDPTIFEGMFRNRQFELSQGAMESSRYFRQQERLIRKEFKFVPRVLEEARKHLEKARKVMKTIFRKDFTNTTYIGVHIRHGDVATDQVVINRGLIAASKEYIYHGLDYFRAKYGNVFFVVSTDDGPWVEEVLKETQKGDIYQLPPFCAPEIDMATLTLCNHTLATTGTYSWWVGYLTNGETVYYKNWPRSGSDAANDFGREDYFPKNWVFLE